MDFVCMYSLVSSFCKNNNSANICKKIVSDTKTKSRYKISIVNYSLVCTVLKMQKAPILPPPPTEII